MEVKFGFQAESSPKRIMLGAQHRAPHEILYVQAPMSKGEEGPHKGPHFLETHLLEGQHGRLSFFITEKRLARSQARTK